MTKIATTRRNSQFLTKNSAYVQSLISFILDTKPYHSKLTDAVEEYQFADEMVVNMEERLSWRSKFDSVWMYEYFSGANPNLRTTHISRLVSYLFNQEPFITGADENSDLALVPFTYSKKQYDGASIAGVKIERSDNTLEPLVESIDWFESLGAFEFRVQQTFEGVSGSPGAKFNPLWQSTMDNNVIQEARHTLRESALDVSNPNSNVNLIRIEIDKIEDITARYGTVLPNGQPTLTHQAIIDELNKIYAILDMPWLPYSYNDLYIALEEDPGVKSKVDFDVLKPRLAFLTPRLFFGEETDNNFREGGLVTYRTVISDHLRVFNIVPDLYADYEEWTLKCVDTLTQTFSVSGSISGYAGSFIAGNSFSFPGHISFSTLRMGGDAGEDFTIKLIPSNRIAIHPSAKLETWNLIKTNPFAFTRPFLNSKSYGGIYDLNNVLGSVSLLSATIPTSTFVLTAVNATTFDVVNTSIPGYKKVARVNLRFNDGIIGFTIKPGTRDYKPGDKFIVDVRNREAYIDNMSLVYGFDMDPYDNGHLAYPNGQSFGFSHDTRFTVFDESLMRLRASEAAKDGRYWRISAQTNKSRPIVTLKKNGTTSTAAVDLDDATSGTPPDPATNAAPRFSLDGTRETPPYNDADLILYYADNFKLEYSDNGVDWTFVQNIEIDQSYNLTSHGLSFIVPTLDKPYIVSSAWMGAGTPRFESGDIFTFRVTNPQPELMATPIGLVSVFAPRIEPHASGFYYAPDANWTIRVLSPTQYRVESVLTSGPDIGKPVPGTPVTCTIPTLNTGTREGHSFKNKQIQFTLIPNDGLSAGDIFTFSTFQDTGTYVVYGSVTGYTGIAKVGEYFWNGAVGFTIRPPLANKAFSSGNEITGALANLISVNRIRIDHEPTIYKFTRSPTGGWLVSNDQVGTVVYVAQTGTLELDQISIKLSSSPALLAAIPTGDYFTVEIDTDSRDLFQPADLVIINPPSTYRQPKIGETVWVQKTTDSHLNIALNPDYSKIEDLMPENIDPRLINIDTDIENSIFETSPELDVMRGFIPVSVTRKDSTTSVAEFYDPATVFEYRSAANGELIGTVKSYDLSDINHTAMFEWDLAFFNKYLPINASASLITQNGGWADKMNVRMTESAKFLIGAGGTDQEFDFSDEMFVHTIESLNWRIKSRYNETGNISVDDGPKINIFDGKALFTFIPGYDAPEFDAPGGYDQGRTFSLDSTLSGIENSLDMTTAILRWNPYLKDGYELPLTFATQTYMQNRLALDPNPGGITNMFGYPFSGVGFDLDQSTNAKMGAKAKEDSQIKIKERGNAHDEFPYDTRPLDISDSEVLQIHPSTLPPYANAPFTPGMTWDEFNAPIETYVAASVFEIIYPSVPQDNLVYRLWVEGHAAPQLVGVVVKDTPKSAKISLPVPAKVKITVL